MLTHVKKLTGSNFAKHFPTVREFYSTRADRKLRVLMTPTARGWQVIGLARKGGQLYAHER